MSFTFNWPEIPFTGAEVEAFVDAYKELAESIIDRWEYEVDIAYSIDDFGNPISCLKAPFTNKRVVKELLEYGLVYASFIIQQRSGSYGPGTDFDLNNSPYKTTLSEEEREYIIKRLGCVFTPEDMKDAWRNRPDKNPDNPERWDNAVEDCLEDLLSDGNPHNGIYVLQCDDLTPPDPPCGVDPLTAGLTAAVANDSGPPPGTAALAGFFQNWSDSGGADGAFFGPLLGWGPDLFVPLKAKTLFDYQTGNGDPITNNNIPQYIYNALKSQIQQTYNEIQTRPEALSVGETNNKIDKNGNPLLTERTGLTEEQRQSWGATSPNDTIYIINFYDSQRLYRSYLNNLFGNATIVVGSDGKVKRIRDDIDFPYANEINRSDGSVAGDPYADSDVSGGLMYGPHAYDQYGNPVALNSPNICTPGSRFQGSLCKPPSDGLTEDQVRDYYENGSLGGFSSNFGRIPAIEAKKRGCGKPVPINIDLSSNQSGSFIY